MPNLRDKWEWRPFEGSSMLKEVSREDQQRSRGDQPRTSRMRTSRRPNSFLPRTTGSAARRTSLATGGPQAFSSALLLSSQSRHGCCTTCKVDISNDRNHNACIYMRKKQTMSTRAEVVWEAATLQLLLLTQQDDFAAALKARLLRPLSPSSCPAIIQIHIQRPEPMSGELMK